HDTIRPRALEIVGHEGPRRAHAVGHQLVDPARAVLAPLRVVADEALERRARLHHLPRQLDELDEAAIPADEPELAVEDADALVDMVEAGLQQGGVIAGDRCDVHRPPSFWLCAHHSRRVTVIQAAPASPRASPEPGSATIRNIPIIFLTRRS